jgi:hypothetical protein
MLRYQFIFISFVMLASCSNTDSRENPTLKGFSKRNISDHWTLQLPIGATIGVMDSFPSNTKKVSFPNDSLFIGCYYWLEHLDRKTDCSFSARVKRMESERCEGICEGDGSIDIKYVPIVNGITQITGCRGDGVENHRPFVLYLVYDCETGEFLTLDFKAISASNYQLVEKIITSLEFQN